VPIEAKMVSKAIKSAQTQVEQQNFEIRKNVLKYDEVMNQQRTVIYEERRRILRGEDMEGQVEQMITDVVTAYVDGATSEGYVEDWDLDQLWTALKTLYPVGIEHTDLTTENEYGEKGDLSRDDLREAVLEDARASYARRETEIEKIAGEGGMRELERRVLLSVLDRKWREHLYEMDYLKEGIGLRAMAQRDPLVEYQREGYDMFTGMLEGLKEESVGFLFNLQVEAAAPSPAAAAGLQVGAGLQSPVSAGASRPAAAPAAQTAAPAAPRETPAPELRKAAPAALRAKGLDDDETGRLTFSGPDESGGTSVRRAGSASGSDRSNDAGSATRRERREAARTSAKPVKRAAKPKRRK
jgi:preprotein translocase subunit SecA